MFYPRCWLLYDFFKRKLLNWIIEQFFKKPREKHMFSGSGKALETAGSGIGGMEKEARDEVVFP